MCGIVGAVLTEGSVLEGLLGGLRVLEYRGYDSAGVALGLEGGVSIRRKAGRIEKLEDAVWASPTTANRRKRLANTISECRAALGRARRRGSSGVGGESGRHKGLRGDL